MGYLRRPSGEVVLDPDEQAHATIRLVFDLLERLRTVGRVLRYLVHRFHEIDRVGLPVISYESCLSCGQHSDLSGPSI
jgi:hypothetical protein